MSSGVYHHSKPLLTDIVLVSWEIGLSLEMGYQLVDFFIYLILNI